MKKVSFVLLQRRNSNKFADNWMNLIQIKFWFMSPIFLSNLLVVHYLLSGFYMILNSNHQLK